MCNIVTELVTEFYLYSIVYIYLINSRLDVTYSVRHHFRIVNFIREDMPDLLHDTMNGLRRCDADFCDIGKNPVKSQTKFGPWSE